MEEEEEEEAGNKDSLHLSGSRTLRWGRVWEEAEGGAMREGGLESSCTSSKVIGNLQEKVTSWSISQ